MTVVSFQHRHYVPLTIGFGLVLPTLIGASYGDALGGFVYGGVVARLLIWHFTFCINSLAHFVGEQAYTLDVTARGNFVSPDRVKQLQLSCFRPRSDDLTVARDLHWWRGVPQLSPRVQSRLPQRTTRNRLGP